MNSDKLTRMANQIASFFRSYPEERAVAGIRDHIVAYWTPTMRRRLLASVDDPALDPWVGKALLGFSAASSPIEKEIAGPEKLGQMESDAG